MPRLSRRTVVGGLAATAPATLITSRALGQSGAPSSPAEIDLAKAKTEGKVVLYTSLDIKIVDAVIKPFKEMHGIDVQYYRGGSNDVTSKVLTEADAGRCLRNMRPASILAPIRRRKGRGLPNPFNPQPLRAGAPGRRDAALTGTADRLTQAVIQYNTKEFGAKPPASWKDLTALS